MFSSSPTTVTRSLLREVRPYVSFRSKYCPTLGRRSKCCPKRSARKFTGFLAVVVLLWDLIVRKERGESMRAGCVVSESSLLDCWGDSSGIGGSEVRAEDGVERNGEGERVGAGGEKVKKDGPVP